jgi:hypothetical protein
VGESEKRLFKAERDMAVERNHSLPLSSLTFSLFPHGKVINDVKMLGLLFGAGDEVYHEKKPHHH